MAPQSALRRKALLESLEKRLDLLARTLDEAEIAPKSVEIVKEIKELHALLHAIRQPRATAAQRLVVVWGSPEQQGASSAGPGRLAAPPLPRRAAQARAPSSGMAGNPGKDGAQIMLQKATQKPRLAPCAPQAEAKGEAGPAPRAQPQEFACETRGQTPRN